MNDKKLLRQLKYEGEQLLPRDKDRILDSVVPYSEASVKREKKFSWWKRLTLAGTACVILAVFLVLQLTIFGGNPQLFQNEGNYVTLSINPAVEFETDDAELVTAVTAMNREAALLLYGINLIGLHIEDACEQIASLAWQYGYLDSNKADNRATVVAVNTNVQKETAVEQSVAQRLEMFFSQNSLQGEIVIGSSQESLKAEAERLGVSLGKMELIVRAQSVFPELKTETLREMSVRALNALITGYNEQAISDFEEELKNGMDNDQNIQSIKEFYRIRMEQANELKKASETIEEMLEEYLKQKKEDILFESIAEAIRTFNADYPEYACGILLTEEKADELCEYFEELTDEAEELEEELEEECEEAIEDYLEKYKKQWKDYLDHDDDDDDDDDD